MGTVKRFRELKNTRGRVNETRIIGTAACTVDSREWRSRSLAKTLSKETPEINKRNKDLRMADPTVHARVVELVRFLQSTESL